jgi:prenyltransferase beta subunit
MKIKCCAYLRRCWNEDEGGFAGAPGLQVHIASNYAAILAIVNIGTEEAYSIVDVAKMKACLLRLKNNSNKEYQIRDQANHWVFESKSTKEVFK